jgi:hypothetical protein
MRSIQSLIKLSPALLAVLFLAGPAPAMADTPCCKITDIDTKKGIVSAREATTGRQFKFSLTNPILVRRIKVGQGVQADFAAGKVTVVGVDGRYPIIDAAPPAAAGAKGPPVAAQGSLPEKNTRSKTAANKICCTITAVDPRSGVVSARDNATGRNFTFTTDNKTLIKELKPGQEVYAHFASKQVSLDGRSACCHITELPPASTDLGQSGSGKGSRPSGGFDQGSAPSGDFDQGSAPSGDFDQGSAPSSDFDQGSVQQGDYGSGQGSYDPGQGGYGSEAAQLPGDPAGAYGAGQGSYNPGQEGYGTGGEQLQGDLPWYEKEQSPVDDRSGGG